MTADRFSSTAALRIAACLVALSVAACSVDAGGAVPCADDSSCPSDYPVCQAGKCVAGTPTGADSVQIVTVGTVAVAAAAPQKGTIHIGVLAKASSGVSSVALTAGTVAATLTTGAGAPTPPLYDFTLDTTAVDKTTPAGVPTTLTATVTAGDKSTGTGTATITVDNVAPGLTGPAGAALAVSTQNALVGTLVTVDVASSETLSSLTGQIQQGSNVAIPMTEMPSGTSGVRRFAYSVSDQTPPGTYNVTFTATDLAGNVTVTPASANPLQFAVGVAISATMTLATHSDGTGHNVLINGLPAATNGDAVTATLSILPSNIALATGYPQYTVVAPDHSTTAITAANDGTGQFQVRSNNATSDGVYTFEAVVKSVDGAIANASAEFIISRVAPKVVGDTNGIAISPAFAGANSDQLTIQFATDSSPAVKAVTVNGNAATIAQSTGNSFAYTYVLSGPDFPASPSVVTVPVVVSIQDSLGNLSQYTTPATVDTLPPTVQTAVSASAAVVSANSVVQLSFALQDANGKVGANPTVTVIPKALGTGSAAEFVSRTDTGSASSFVYQYKVGVADLEGAATVTIAATDAALNPLPTTSQAAVFIIDRTPPAFTGLAVDHVVQSKNGTVTVTVSERECNPTAAAPTIAFVDGTTGATVDSGSMSGSATPGCSSGAVYTFTHTVGTNETNGGQVTATVSAVDKAGNGATQSVFYTVDNSAPSLLASSSFSPVTNNTGATTFTLVASKPLASQTVVKVNNGTNTLGNTDAFGGGTISIAPAGGTTFPCTSCAYTITGLAPSGASTVTWHAVVTMFDTVPTQNSATATSTASFFVDTTIPTVTGTISVTPAVVRAQQQVTITGTASKALSAVSVSTTNASQATADATNLPCSFNASNVFTCVVPVKDTSNESVPVTVKLTDSVGNVTSPAISAPPYVVDNLAPTAPVASVGTGNTVGTFVSNGFPFKKASTVTLEVTTTDTNLQSVSAAVSYVSTNAGHATVSAPMTATVSPASPGGTFLFQRAVAADEPDGATSVSIQAIDLAGNVSIGSSNYVVDNTAPTLLNTSSISPTTSYDGNATFTLIASEPLLTATVSLLQNGATPVTAGTISLSGATPFPCTTCVYNLAGLRRVGNIDTWTIKATAGTDLAGNAISNLATWVSPSVTVDGVSTAFTLNNIKINGGTSAVFVHSSGAAPATIVITGTSNRALSAVSLSPIVLSPGGAASGDTSTCSFTNTSNQAAVSCVITVGSLEGLRAFSGGAGIQGSMTDIGSNTATFNAAPAYTVDNTSPAFGSAVVSGGGALPNSGGPVFSQVNTFNQVTVQFPVTDCDASTAVTVVAVDANGAARSFNTGSNGGSIGCSSAKSFGFTHSISNDANGVTTVTATAVDRAGNTSTATATYTVDTASPSIVGTPTISAATNNTGSFTLVTTFSELVSVTGGGATMLTFTDGTNTYTSGTTTNGVTPTISTTGSSCSVCTFTVTNLVKSGSKIVFKPVFNVVDFAGNQLGVTLNSPTFAGDNVAIDMTISSTTPSTVGQNALTGKVTIVGTATKKIASASVAVTGGTPNPQDTGTCSVDPATQLQITCVITISDTENTVVVTKTATISLTDIAQNPSPTTGQTNFAHFVTTYTLDNLSLTVGAPSLPTSIATGQTATLGGAVTKSGATPTLSAASYIIAFGGPSAPANVTGACTVSGATYSCLVTSKNTTVNGLSADTVEIDVVDIAGNTANKKLISLTIDNRNASAGTFTASPTSVVTGAGSSVTLNWGAASVANCTVAGSCFITSSADSAFNIPVSNNNAGSATTNAVANSLSPTKSTVYSLTVTAVNGTTSTQTASLSVAPTIGAFTPSATSVTGTVNVSFSGSVSGVHCNGAGSGASSCVLTSTDGTYGSQAISCTSFASNTCTLTAVGATTGGVAQGGATYTLTAIDANSVPVVATATVKEFPAATESAFTISGFTTAPTKFSALPSNAVTYTGGSSPQPTFSWNVSSSGGCATGGNCTISCVGAGCGGGSAAVSADTGTASWSTPVTGSVTFTLNVKNPAGTSAVSPLTATLTSAALPTVANFQVASIATTTSTSPALPSAGPIFTTGSSPTPTLTATVTVNGACAAGAGNPCFISCAENAGGSCGGVYSRPLAVVSDGTAVSVAWTAAITGSVSFSLNVVNSAGASPSSPPSAIAVTNVAAPTSSAFTIQSIAGATNSLAGTSALYTGGSPIPTFSWSAVSGSGCSTPGNCKVTCAAGGGSCNGGSAAISSDSGTVAWSTSVTGLVTFTLVITNPAGATLASPPTATLSSVLAPAATAGTFSAPSVISQNSLLPFTLPSTYSAGVTSAVIQVSGAAVTADVHSLPSTNLSSPDVTTAYSLVATNTVGATATIGTVTVRAAGSQSSDVIPSALFGAASAVIGGAGSHAGQVLITGGSTTAFATGSAAPAGLTTTYYFNPTTGAIAAGPALNSARAFHTATAMAGTGKIIIAGGSAGATTFDLYDDGPGTITTLGTAASQNFCFHGAAALDATHVGFFGGTNCTTTAGQTTVTIVDNTGTVTTTVGSGSNGQLTVGRAAPSVALLGASNKVLIAGGYTTAGTSLSSMDVFTYVSGVNIATSSVTASANALKAARSGASATLYSAATCDGGGAGDCTVLVAGGNGGATSTADVVTFHSSTATVAATAGEMNAQRMFAGATLLSSGTGLVFIAGGFNGTSAVKTTEVFDSTKGLFYAAAPMGFARQQFPAILAGTSPFNVLLAGGAAGASSVVEEETITQ